MTSESIVSVMISLGWIVIKLQQLVIYCQNAVTYLALNTVIRFVYAWPFRFRPDLCLVTFL
jgi:hypothetical protein